MSLVDLVREDFGISGGDRWYRSDTHSSLVVDSKNDIFFFNSRGLSGNALDYLVKVRGLSRHTAQDMLKHPTAQLPTGDSGVGLQVRFARLVDLFYNAGKKDRDYWYERKITDPTIDRYRLGNFDGWNLIPIYDEGRFINFQCRRDKPDKRIRFWYKDKDFKPVLFNSDILPFIDTVYIVEGMTDCILLNQLGLPSVCSTNGALSWNQGWIKYFNRIDNIYFIADNDKAGISAANLVVSSLGPYRVKVLRFKDKPEKYGVGNHFISGGTIEEFKNILNDKAFYGFERSLI